MPRRKVSLPLALALLLGTAFTARLGAADEETVEIPSDINGVAVEFASTVNRQVNPRVVEGLKHVIKPDIAAGYKLEKIWISSASDSHEPPSRHSMKKAVDISRINGKHMITHYDSDEEVKAITKAIQEKFESYEHRRENFGPHFKKKLGKPYEVADHKDHVHHSVN